VHFEVIKPDRARSTSDWLRNGLQCETSLRSRCETANKLKVRQPLCADVVFNDGAVPAHTETAAADRRRA
jgi:hypothetical protein